MRRHPINTHNLFPKLVSSLIITLILAACGGGADESSGPAATAAPSPTFTPISTELPPVPTQMLVGTAEQPIKLAFLAETTAASNRAAASLEDAFAEELDNFTIGFYDGLTVEIEFLETPQEAINLLCTSRDTAVFADAFTYAAAQQQCGVVPALRVEKEGQTGQNLTMVVYDARVFTLADMRSYRFCTTSLDDFTYFVYPALAFQAAGVNPLEEINEIITGYETDESLIVAVSGQGGQPQCEAAALSIPPEEFAPLVESMIDNDDPEISLTQFQSNAVSLLEPPATEAWEPIPYEVLVFPPPQLFPDNIRQEIITAILAIQENEAAIVDELKTLVEHDSLIPILEDDLVPFLTWLERTGWNMAVPR